MPDPTYRTEPGFPQAVARRLRELAEFEGLPATTLGQVHDALLTLTSEVRQLRAAIEPSRSPIVHGAEAVRAFRDLHGNVRANLPP